MPGNKMNKQLSLRGVSPSQRAKLSWEMPNPAIFFSFFAKEKIRTSLKRFLDYFDYYVHMSIIGSPAPVYQRTLFDFFNWDGRHDMPVVAGPLGTLLSYWPNMRKYLIRATCSLADFDGWLHFKGSFDRGKIASWLWHVFDTVSYALKSTRFDPKMAGCDVD